MPARGSPWSDHIPERESGLSRLVANATREYGSSWLFELRLTWANALRRVQRSPFSLGNWLAHEAICHRVTQRSTRWHASESVQRIMAHAMASSSAPGCVAHTTRPTVQAGTRTLVGPADPVLAGLRSFAGRLDTATGSPAGLELASRHRARARVLIWCPGGRGSGTTCCSSTATRTHGCGVMGPGRSGRAIGSWGTLGARTDSIQRTVTDSPGKRMSW
jgi:hypothetical protein